MRRIRVPRLTSKNIRDFVTFLIGAAGLVFETVSNGVEKPTLIIAFVGLMGLPLFVRGDEARKQAEELTPTPPTVVVRPDPPDPEVNP